MWIRLSDCHAWSSRCYKRGPAPPMPILRTTILALTLSLACDRNAAVPQPTQAPAASPAPAGSPTTAAPAGSPTTTAPAIAPAPAPAAQGRVVGLSAIAAWDAGSTTRATRSSGVASGSSLPPCCPRPGHGVKVSGGDLPLHGLDLSRSRASIVTDQETERLDLRALHGLKPLTPLAQQKGRQPVDRTID